MASVYVVMENPRGRGVNLMKGFWTEVRQTYDGYRMPEITMTFVAQEIRHMSEEEFEDFFRGARPVNAGALFRGARPVNAIEAPRPALPAPKP